MKGTLCLMIAFVLLRKERKGLVDGTELQILGLNFTNHSMNASVETTPASTTEPQKIGDNTFRSEVYKLHANSLILLHAQRTKSGIGAKKSQLNVKSANTGINYHTRKKTNDTVNVVRDIEKQLEAKLGDLPQIRQKRSSNHQNVLFRNKDITSGNKSSETPCSRTMHNLTDSADCQHHGHHHHHHHRHSHRHSRKRQWRSIIQGEDIYGEEVKKTKVYPEKFPDRRKSKSKDKRNKLSEFDTLQNSMLPASNDNSKRHKLRRALSLMGSEFDDNPLYDSQNGGDSTKNSPQASQDSSLKKDQQDDPVSVAPPVILPLHNSIDKSLQLKYLGRSFDFHGTNGDMYEDMPSIPQIPKIDEDFQIPHISRIKPIGRDDELEEELGEKRQLVSLDQFEDDEQEDKIIPVKRMTEPTPIPDLSTISNIPDITDIPTLKSIPAPERDKKKGESYENHNL